MEAKQIILWLKKFKTYLWHAWLSSSRSSTFDEELEIMTRHYTLLHISLQQASVDVVLATVFGIDFPLNEECAETPKQRSKI